MCTRPYFPPGRGMPVPCGKCVECCMSYSNMWAQRIVDEASMWQENCMITLTYSKTDGNLCKRDLQLFIKRLRDRIKPIKIRYFACGEYGGKGNRPHYHIIIFNWFPNDCRFVKKENDVYYYASDFVSEVWGNGFISVGNVTIKSAKYCAKYLSKIDKRHHDVKPFTLMSRKPGIGAYSINPDMLLTGSRYFDGKIYQIPKYYLDKLEQNGYYVDILKATRKNYVNERYGDYYRIEEHIRNSKKEREVDCKYFG